MPNNHTKRLLLQFIASLNLFVEISRPQLHSLKFYRAPEEQKSGQNEYVYSETHWDFSNFSGSSYKLIFSRALVVSESLLPSPTLQHPHGILLIGITARSLGKKKFIESNGGGRLHKVKSRYYQLYIIFASAPIWFKARTGIYWWASHYEKWFIPYYLIFIMIQSKVNCTHAICCELIQWKGKMALEKHICSPFHCL